MRVRVRVGGNETETEREGNESESESERLWEDSVGLSVFEFEWLICVLSDGHVEGWIEIEFKRLNFHLN